MKPINKIHSKNKGIIFVLFFLCFSLLSALPVRKTEILSIVEQWTQDNYDLSLSDNLSKINIEVVSGDTLYYEIEFRSGGFLILSADDSTTPIIGYSYENLLNLDETHPAINEMRSSWKEQITYNKFNNITNEQSIELWNVVKAGDFQEINDNKAQIGPLLSTTWNQGWPYNQYCPSTSSGGSGGKVWAGCVATAMAQVMKYHNFPSRGQGSHSYYHSTYGTQSANFNTTYNWDDMNLNSGDSDNAKLIRHLGVAVNMDYSPSGSGAYSSTALSALKTYFKYDTSAQLQYKNYYSYASWVTKLKNELTSGRPLYYHGYGSGGHAFNVDGWKTGDYFHLNWGWGGYYNGWFTLSDLTPGSYSFTSSQGAMINLKPSNKPVINLNFKNKTLTHLSGTFTLNISNAGTGILNWEAVSNDNWLTIISSSTGTNSGVIEVAYTELTESLRDGSISISSNCSIYPEVEINIYQIEIDGFSDLTKWSNSFAWSSEHERCIGDVNGDGNDDIVGFVNGSGVYVGLSNSSSIDEITIWSNDFAWNAEHKRVLGDVNGDGKDDVVGFVNGGGVYVALSTGTSFGSMEYWSSEFNWAAENKRFVSDANGDGKDDIIGFANSSGVYVALSNGSSFNNMTKWTSDFAWATSHLRTVGDVNGDGKADIVGFASGSGTYVALSNGNSFDSKSQWTTEFGWNLSHKRLICDIDRDGNGDIVGFVNGGDVIVAFSQSDKFIPGIPLSSQLSWNEDNKRNVGDINGDGMVDLIGFANSSGVYVSLATSAILEVLQSGVNFLSQSESKNMNINFEGSETADWEIVSNSNWVSFSENNGSGSDIVNISVSDNYGPERNTVIQVISPDTWNYSEEIVITQAEGGGFDELEFQLNDFGWHIDHNRVFADVDGDNKEDLIGFANNSGVYVSLSTSEGLSEKNLWSSDFGWNYVHRRTAADVNGDGKADVIGFVNGGGVYVALSSGTDFGEMTLWSNDFRWAYKNLRTTGDVNGDGKDDLIGFANSSGVYVALSNGSSFNSIQKWSDDFGWAMENTRTLGDVNGDGKDDIIGFANSSGVYVGISNGTGFIEMQKWSSDFAWSSEHIRKVADVNGDGKDDIVGFINNKGVYVAISKGDYFEEINQWSTDFAWSSDHLKTVGDINGDSLDDIIGFAVNSGVYVAKAYSLQTTESVLFDESLPKIVKVKNYPNPFNPRTKIVFEILEDKKLVNIDIYNIKGQRVKNLLNSKLDKGFHEVEWNSTNNNGEKVGSGIYFYRINFDKKTSIISKMTLLK